MLVKPQVGAGGLVWDELPLVEGPAEAQPLPPTVFLHCPVLHRLNIIACKGSIITQSWRRKKAYLKRLTAIFVERKEE